MTLAKRRKQLERRKNIAASTFVGMAFIGMILFCNKMGSMGSTDFKEYEDKKVMTPPVEVIQEEPETEFTLTEVAVPVVEEVNEWEEFQPETEEIANTSPSYSNADLEELAHLIYAEAGSESDKALYYTGSVVLNRVKSSKYPNTIHKVINQKGQYGVRSYYMKKKPTDRCYSIAKDLLENGSKLPADCLGQASKTIYKKYGKKLYAKIGNIYFFSIK